MSSNIVLTPAFIKLGRSPVILAQIFLASEAWRLQTCCLPHENFTFLIHRKESTICCMSVGDKQQLVVSLLIIYHRKKISPSRNILFSLWTGDDRVMNGHS